MRLTILLFILWLFPAAFVFSQTPVSISASVDKNDILIGEQIRLTIDVKVPLGVSVSWFKLDTIPHFDFIDKGKIDSSITETDRSFHQQLIITSFDSGMQVIHPLALNINGKDFFSDSISVNIKYKPIDPKQDYHDIKDILDAQNPFTKYIVWAIAAITLISIALVVYFITRKQAIKSQERKEITRFSAYEEAVKSLEELKKQQLTKSGQTKLYYSRLNDILRLFVLRKLQIASMVKTNEELILQLKELDISREQFLQLAQALRMSDFVKFAKYLPDENENEKNFDTIKSSVDLLNAIEK